MVSEKKTLPNTEFAKAVMEMSVYHKDFTPQVQYDEDGDCLEVLLESGAFYGVYINENLTNYRSEFSDEHVGCCISGVRRIIAPDPRTQGIIEACNEFRDALLHGRHQLAENGMSSEQTNDVLGLFDDTIGNALQDAEPNSETESKR